MQKKPVDEYLMRKDEIITCPVCNERMFAIKRNIKIEDDIHLDEDFRPIDLRYRYYFEKGEVPPCLVCHTFDWWKSIKDALYIYSQRKLREEGAFNGIKESLDER